MKVPFLDLKAQYHNIKAEIDQAIQNVLDNTAFVLGKNVSDFEENFAKFCNVKHAIGVNSGTAALHCALFALGIKPGDEVITVPNTFFATAEAIVHCGATPVFCDISEETYNINPDLIEQKITEKTKAIIPVHLYGNPCDMGRINEIAKKHNLKVVEDACQAHGAEFKGNRVGSMSDVAAFSFYPGKNLGAYGEGGMIVTNDDSTASHARLFRAHGENPKNTHAIVGYNYRLEGIQGAVLGVKLKYLEGWNEARRKCAALYTELLQSTVITPKISADNKSVFHLYVIRHKRRDELREFLESKGVASGIHYTTPIHLQKAFEHLGYKEGDFPVAEKVMKEIVSLPIYPEMTDEQITYVADAVKEFVKGSE